MLSDRKWKVVALATVFYGCSGDGGGIAGTKCPYQGLEGLSATDPKCVAPVTDNVSVTILSPAASMEQTAMPATPVELSVEAISAIKGKISDSTLIVWKEGDVLLGKGTVLTVPFSNGAHTVSVTVTSPATPSVQKTAYQSFTITPASPIRFEISSEPVDGVGVTCSNFRAFVSNGSVTDSAEIDSACKAEVSPRLYLLSNPGRVAVWIDAKNRAARTHFPSYQPSVSKDSLKQKQGFVLTPLVDHVPSGMYVGQDAAIDLEKACAETGTGIGIESFFHCHFGGKWVYSLPVWRSLPIIAAFDHDSSTRLISASDSVGVWSVLTRLNWMIGMEVLRPANQSDLHIVDRATGAFEGVRISFKPNTLLGSPQKTSGGWIVSANLILNDVWLGTPFITEPLIAHEGVHAMGIFHSYSWGIGLMNSSPPPGNDPSYGVMNLEEVAHFRILYKIEELRKNLGFQYGIAQAHQGQRVIMLKLPSEDISY